MALQSVHRAWAAVVARLPSLVALAVLCAWGATPTAQAQQYTFHHYDQKDGLTNLSVSCLLQDRSGFIWMCTGNGLFRHDGNHFERFSESSGLTDTDINNLIEDPSGRLWVDTPRDLFAGDARGFRPIRPDGRHLNIDKGRLIAALSDHELLVIEHEQLLRLSTQDQSQWHGSPYFTAAQLRRYPALSHLGSLFVDPRGTIWLGCGLGICAVSPGHVRVFGAAEGVPEDDWLTWLADRDGRLWVRGLSHIATLDAGAQAFRLRDAPHGALTSDILFVPMVEDARGFVVTRSDVGLVRWESDHWQELTAANGIPAYGIYALMVAHDGSMWLGSSGYGAYRWLGYGEFEAWTTHQGLAADPIWAVLRDHRGTVYLSTRTGCYALDESAHRAVPCHVDGMPTGELQVMAERHDGSLWVGTTTGRLVRIDPLRQHAQVISVIPKMRKLFVDSTDRLWICSNDGVRVVQPGTVHPDVSPLPRGMGEVTDAAEDSSGQIWMAAQGGLLRLRDNRWNVLTVSDEHGQDGFGTLLMSENGWLWAGSTNHGLMRLHVQGDRIDAFHWVDDPAVAQSDVYFLMQDAQRHLWAGTDGGLAVYDGRTWRHFTEDDGLIWNDTNESSNYADMDGSLWVGTSGGLTHVLHPSHLLSSAPLRLQVTRASLGPLHLGIDDAKVPWARNLPLDVTMADLDYEVAEHIVMNVRLLGLSDEWFQTHNGVLHYPALAPGHYVLEAYASDPEQKRISSVTRITFDVTPLWWQSTWLKVLCAVTAAAVIVLAWRWRTRNLDRRRRELEQTLREREVLLERATRDALTKLWNRATILDILERQIEAAGVHATPLALALIDIDHFKRINDTYGHLVGDTVLRTLGQQVPLKLRPVESLGRYGGEELLLVMPGFVEQQPSLPMERLRRAVSEVAILHEGVSITVTVSIGVAWLRPNETAETLIGRADAALYLAKGLGRNRVEYAETPAVLSTAKHSA